MQVDVEARYASLVQASPSDGDLLYLLSLTRNDSESALADLEKAARHGSVDALLPLARRHLALGEFDEAILQMDQALDAQPDNADLIDLQQELLMATGQFPLLIEVFRERFHTDPLDQYAATTLAGLYDACLLYTSPSPRD